jgi:hypothetical protein
LTGACQPHYKDLNIIVDRHNFNPRGDCKEKSMLNLVRVAGLVLLSLLLPSAILATPARFLWKSEFSDVSSAALTELHESLYASKGKEEDFELKIRSGTIFLEPPIDGITAGGFFEGDAVVSYRARSETGRNLLQIHLDREEIVNEPIQTAYLFSLRSDSPLMLLRESDPGDAPKSPAALDTYMSDKSAMSQLGLDLTWLFLNRTGPAEGATYVLFPMEAIRTKRSEEARILYIFNPMDEVQLTVFGHEEMVARRPYKFRFYPLVTYPPREGTTGMIDVERTKVKLTQGTGAETAVEDAEIQFHNATGLKGLRLKLTPQMAITKVTSSGGDQLPFLQWQHLRNDPDFDQTFLIALNGAPDVPETETLSITIHSEGVLFEPWFSSFVLIDEDDWCPNPYVENAQDDAHYELDLTTPKKFVGIGVGEKILDEVSGKFRHVIYRTTNPAKNSTLYVGDYRTTTGTADDIEVELFQQRTNVAQRKNAKFMLTEITNALKVFNRMYVPLDIKHLRVTSTMTRHGRGFEGLILLGARGTETAESSYADLFRAHEVAHQWWGHYIRPKRWPEDRWLSEAFAEYSAMEYYKIRFEDPRATIDVMNNQWIRPLTMGTTHATSLTGEKEVTKGRTIYPIAAGFNNVYTKGPMVLQMLRYLYDATSQGDAFLPMLRDFLETYRYKSASTKDFHAIAEKHLGADLDWFFEQWIERGGIPILSWKYSINQQEGNWIAQLQARQEEPHYRLLVPIYFHFGGDKVAIRPWLIQEKATTRKLKLPAKPSKITLNDNLEALIILQPL